VSVRHPSISAKAERSEAFSDQVQRRIEVWTNHIDKDGLLPKDRGAPKYTIDGRYPPVVLSATNRLFESVAAFCLIVMLASVAAPSRVRGELRQARAMCAILETVPLDWWRWRITETDIHVSSNASGYNEFLEKLPAAGAKQLERARQAL